MLVSEWHLFLDVSSPHSHNFPHLPQALAVKATAAFLLLHESETGIHKSFAELLLPMLNIIAESVQAGEDDALLKSLVDVAETCPKYLRPQLEPILQLTVKVRGVVVARLKVGVDDVT